MPYLECDQSKLESRDKQQSPIPVILRCAQNQVGMGAVELERPSPAPVILSVAKNQVGMGAVDVRSLK